MKDILDRLSGVKWLVATGIAMVALHFLMFRLREATGGTSLDFKLTGAGALAYLELIRTLPGAIDTHRLMTGVLDMAYPLAYGSFLAGLTLRYGGRKGALLAVPILLGAVFDLGENVVQLIALYGHPAVLHAKTLLTPAKFVLVLIGSVIATLAWAGAMARLIRMRPR